VATRAERDQALGAHLHPCTARNSHDLTRYYELNGRKCYITTGGRASCGARQAPPQVAVVLASPGDGIVCQIPGCAC
jgi:hypothetical protein